MRRGRLLLAGVLSTALVVATAVAGCATPAPPLTTMAPGWEQYFGVTWETAQRGFARRLPVELTMANDLPVMLDPSIKGRIPYGHDPTVLLYFLDQHAYPPEPDGMWVAGGGRADIIVRTNNRIDHFTMTVSSPINTRFTVSAGAESRTMALLPEKKVTFDVPASGIKGFRSYAYLMSAQSSDGFVPHLRDPKSPDYRNLGVQVTFQAIEAR